MVQITRYVVRVALAALWLAACGQTGVRDMKGDTREELAQAVPNTRL